MADALFVAVALGFFGLCVGYVKVLDRMVRGSDEDEAGTGELPETELAGEAR
jgi:hypothetical protein